MSIHIEWGERMKANGSASADFVIEGARRSDLIGIRWLLAMERLPSDDIVANALELFLVCRDEVGVIGVVGLECWEGVAVLRSLVVADQYAGRGLGRRLVAAAEELAAALQARAVYLRTAQAEPFFEHLGFRRISHDELPTSIGNSRHFTGDQSADAALMVKP